MIYAGDSAADEFAMEALRGVAYTFKVINEDTTAVTKTWANSRLQGPDSVLTMLKFLERKMSGRKIRSKSRSSISFLEPPPRELLEVYIDDVSNRKFLKEKITVLPPRARKWMVTNLDKDRVLCPCRGSSEPGFRLR